MVAGSRRWSWVILLAVLNTLPGPSRPLRADEPAPCCHSWAGIYPTVITPFCHDGIDVASLEQQLVFQLHGGVHGLLLLGTIGEGQYVTDEERAQVIATGVRVACKKVPVVVGIHTCAVDVARYQLLQAQQLGADAVLVKYIGNPCASGSEVLVFFASLAEMNALPIFYYHYPSNTHLKLSPQDVASILSLPGVVGIKESTLDLKEIQAHMRLTCGLGKTFLSGSALNLTQFMKLGGHGAMCAEALLMPGPTVQAYVAYVHGDRRQARSIQKDLFEILPILKDKSGPVGISRAVFMCAQDHKCKVSMGDDHPQARLKFALNCLGVPTPVEVKPPLPPLSCQDMEHVKKAVGKIQKIDWLEVSLMAPPIPLDTCPDNVEKEPGALLKTGAFQLGPNVGKDLLGSQSDGQSGFFRP